MPQMQFKTEIAILNPINRIGSNQQRKIINENNSPVRREINSERERKKKTLINRNKSITIGRNKP